MFYFRRTIVFTDAEFVQATAGQTSCARHTRRPTAPTLVPRSRRSTATPWWWRTMTGTFQGSADMNLDAFASARVFCAHLKKWGKSIVGDRSHDHKRGSAAAISSSLYLCNSPWQLFCKTELVFQPLRFREVWVESLDLESNSSIWIQIRTQVVRTRVGRPPDDRKKTCGSQTTCDA